jgi:hypothetical protein
VLVYLVKVNIGVPLWWNLMKRLTFTPQTSAPAMMRRCWSAHAEPITGMDYSSFAAYWPVKAADARILRRCILPIGTVLGED